MSGGAWGVGVWGFGSWGGVGLGGAGVPLSIAGALATSTNTVLVTTSVPPLASSPIAQGDALNPATWSVTRAGFAYTVLAVRQVSSTEFEIRVLEPFVTWLTTHTVSSSTLIDPIGDLVTPPESATFAGVEAVTQPFIDAGVVDFDIANPQAPLTGTPGVMRVTAAGDYEVEAGAAYAEKLITRAITTALGGFFHLPDYGFGLGDKQNVTPSKFGRLKADLVRVVEAVTVVDAADVSLSFENATGILTVTTSATLRNNGQSVTVVNRIPTRGIQL